MLIVRPELEKEWDYEKNDKLGLDINKITKGMGKNAWWICSKCSSSYDTLIRKRVQGSNCPYCAGKRVNKTNSLSSLRPELAKQWHPTKNGNLTPHDVTCGKRLKVWWLGECGHEWEINIRNRNNGSGCPMCAKHSKPVLKGCNDMWTTNPELAKLLDNPEDGYKYSHGSRERLDWKCSNCKEIIKNKIILDINRNGISCKKCGDGISYGEKIVYNMLSQQEVIFEKEVVFDWSDLKRYDFYLPKYNAILEVHGRQHFEQTARKGARTLEEEQTNDRYKYEMAMKNGIDRYMIIDARYSDLEWIKNKILESSIYNFINLDVVDWIECNKYASKSLIVEVCEYWKSNRKPSTAVMSNEFKLSVGTIVKFLKQGRVNGWCDYDVKESRIKGMRLLGIERRKVIYQLNINEEFIREWDYINDISHEFDVTPSAISKACKSKSHKSCGFKWMHKEDYDKMVKSK